MNSTSNPRIKILRAPQGCASYVISDEQKFAVIIDPIAELYAQYIDYISKAALKVTTIIETHTHADHFSAGPKLSEEFKSELIVGKNSKILWPSKKVATGDRVTVGSLGFVVIETPGHTSDSICLELKTDWGAVLFTGDSLFIGGTGRTDFPGSDSRALFQSLCKLKEYKNHFILPGHDYSGQLFSTVQLEKNTNPQFAIESEDLFVSEKSGEEIGVSNLLRAVLDYNLGIARELPVMTVGCGETHGTSCSSVAMSLEHLNCDVNAAYEGIKNGAFGIDLRDPEEVSKAKLPGFLPVPLSDLMAKLEVIRSKVKANSPIYLICRTGNTSKMAATTLARLQSQGLFPKTDLYSVDGGATSWRISGLPTQKS